MIQHMHSLHLRLMSEIKLGIIGGGQRGSMLSDAAKKLNINTKEDQNIPI